MLNEEHLVARAELNRVTAAFRALGFEIPSILAIRAFPDVEYFAEIGPVPISDLTRLAEVLEKAAIHS